MELLSKHTDAGFLIEFKSPAAAPEIEPLTQTAYAAAKSLAADEGYPEFLRIWNFIPQINHFENDLENYQRFCAGRKRAFSLFQLPDSQFPAASAVGSRDGLLRFQFLFCHETPMKISNPAQVEAYRYPVAYGPTPPSFARAAALDEAFYLSGTASIRGHQTQHAENLLPQLDCTLENIDLVLQETERKTGRLLDKKTLRWRVYLKRPEFQSAVTDRLLAELGPQLEFVEADICRAELLIEIEGSSHGL